MTIIKSTGWMRMEEGLYVVTTSRRYFFEFRVRSAVSDNRDD
jgi:hypothetical protein